MKEIFHTGFSLNKILKNNAGIILGLTLLSSLTLPQSALAQRPDRQDHPNTQRPDREVNRSSTPNRNRDNNRYQNNDRNASRYQSNDGSYNRSERTRTPNHYPNRYRERELAYNNRREPRRYPSAHYPAPNHYRSPNWNYRSLPRWGYSVPMAPRNSVSIAFGGVFFHYDNGVYYRPVNGRYVVVPAPIGLRTRFIPSGYRQFFINQRPYYYYFGTYYQLQNSYYEVVKPPVGALVESIPDGYEQVIIDGETYYLVDGVQYKPVLNNNEIWYEVLKVD